MNYFNYYLMENRCGIHITVKSKMSIYRGNGHFRCISAKEEFMKPFKWMFEEQNATEIEYKGKQVSALY